MAILACEERRGLPEYMKRPCPIGLRDGRRWKTKLRLGRHQLQSSLAVRERGRDQSETRDYACKFCNLHVDETAEHALMECQGHVDEREFFLARMDEIAPEFRRIRQDEKMKILMADETPAKLTTKYINIARPGAVRALRTRASPGAWRRAR